MSEETDAKEVAAIDAIIAASLAVNYVEDFDDEELLRRCEASPPLSDSGKEILRRIGAAPFSPGKETRPSLGSSEALRFAGIYREGSDEGLERNVQDEIDRRREELREHLRKGGADARSKD